MSAIYNINEKYDLALGTMEVSYMKGLLSKPEEFSNLASFYHTNRILLAQQECGKSS